jgi:hypothetical protein
MVRYFMLFFVDRILTYSGLGVTEHDAPNHHIDHSILTVFFFIETYLYIYEANYANLKCNALWWLTGRHYGLYHA